MRLFFLFTGYANAVKHLLTLLLSLVPFALADCIWQEAAQVGSLDGNIVHESSGISQSFLVPDRLYHVNDSGSDAVFYTSSLSGENLREIRITDFDASDADMEDTSVGVCGTDTCLFIGDIGDNRAARASIRIVLIKEQAVFPDAVLPYKTLHLRYPDGAHNAEGLAVHPSGDIYILTKPSLSLASAAEARLYRLSEERWQRAGERAEPLELVGLIDIKALSGAALDVPSHTVTALDISRDGQKLLILSYGNAYELAIDLATLNSSLPVDLGTNASYRQMSLLRLPQQESATYVGSAGFIYTTEARGADVPIMKVACF